MLTIPVKFEIEKSREGKAFSVECKLTGRRIILRNCRKCRRYAGEVEKAETVLCDDERELTPEPAEEKKPEEKAASAAAPGEAVFVWTEKAERHAPHRVAGTPVIFGTIPLHDCFIARDLERHGEIRRVTG